MIISSLLPFSILFSAALPWTVRLLFSVLLSLALVNGVASISRVTIRPVFLRSVPFKLMNVPFFR